MSDIIEMRLKREDKFDIEKDEDTYLLYKCVYTIMSDFVPMMQSTANSGNYNYRIFRICELCIELLYKQKLKERKNGERNSNKGA